MDNFQVDKTEKKFSIFVFGKFGKFSKIPIFCASLQNHGRKHRVLDFPGIRHPAPASGIPASGIPASGIPASGIPASHSIFVHTGSVSQKS
jgi:hypothetical protein